MTVFLKTSTDGWGEEGIGSVVQWNILLYALSKDLDVKFCADSFSNINHYQYNNISCEEWSNQFTQFFNFEKVNNPDLEINFYGNLLDLKNHIDNHDKSSIQVLNIPKQFIVNNCLNRLDEFSNKNLFSEIKNNLFFDDNTYFENTYLNICLHLRSTNPSDIPPEFPAMETYGIWIGGNKIINLINQLKELYSKRNVKFYIHSQGEETNFLDLKEQTTEKFIVELKLNQTPASDLYHMSNADVLILAKSSYSWIAHLLNNNLIFARNDFHQPIKSDVIKLDLDYNFDPLQLNV